MRRTGEPGFDRFKRDAAPFRRNSALRNVAASNLPTLPSAGHVQVRFLPGSNGRPLSSDNDGFFLDEWPQLRSQRFLRDQIDGVSEHIL
jgi:hypothetical protein